VDFRFPRGLALLSVSSAVAGGDHRLILDAKGMLLPVPGKFTRESVPRPDTL